LVTNASRLDLRSNLEKSPQRRVRHVVRNRVRNLIKVGVKDL